MATIGLDGLHFADITEDPSTGYETYGTPFAAAGVQSANFDIRTSVLKMYADDGTWETMTEFTDGTITLSLAQLGPTLAAHLAGAWVDGNGVQISTRTDDPPPVAAGFRSRRADGTYEYIWLCRVVFGIPKHDYQTKGDGISFQNTTIEGTILRRRKPDQLGRHPWRIAALPDTATAAARANWFTRVYYVDPAYAILDECILDEARLA